MNNSNNVEKKIKTVQAILFSLLIIIVGAVVWGVVYSIGIIGMVYLMAPPILAVFVYKKYKPDGEFGMLILILLSSYILNFICMALSASIVTLLSIKGYTFGEVFPIMVKSLFTTDLIDCVLAGIFISVGTVVAFALYNKKIRRSQEANRNNFNNQQNINQNYVNVNPNFVNMNNTQQTNFIPRQQDFQNGDKTCLVLDCNGLVSQIASYIKLYKQELITKSEYVQMLEKFKIEVINKLNDEQKRTLIEFCSNEENVKGKILAARLLIKLIG